jgi:diguanylate cyclase (GGDEF)-like protein
MAGSEVYHVLLVDGRPGDARLTSALLRDDPSGRFRVTHARTHERAVQQLRRGRHDVVLLDLMLPDLGGLDAVRGLLAVASEVPLVVLSRIDDERLALEAVLHGAQDYLIKGQVDAALLRRAIRHAIERKRVELELSQLARYDALTGLPNRLLFRDRLTHAMRRADPPDRLVALIFIDLDEFKQVNDRFGHAAGDRLLQAVAGRVERAVRRTDTVARLGGDEFTIILEGLQCAEDAARIAEKVLESLRRPFLLDDVVVPLSASLGIAIAAQGERPDALTRRADAAMYRAKAQGGTGYRLDAAA